MNLRILISTLALTLELAGCAAMPPGAAVDPRDRFERANRAVYKVNNALDHAVLRPVTRGYVKVTPVPMQRGIHNFLANFDYPVTIVNDYLQGKVRNGTRDLGRFFVNSVVGIGGFFDPATRWGLEKHNEDFGQTLGKWGVPSGPYLMVPLLGPSTVRDLPARLVDRFVTPASYLHNTAATVGLLGAGVVNTRAGLLDTDHVVDTAFDPYAFIRNAWLQRRQFEVMDGHVPNNDLFKSDEGLPLEPER